MIIHRRIILAALISIACAGSVSADESLWRAGVAKVKITPSEPMWMAGYAARDKPSAGTLHDLYAKALALESGGERLVIVTTDLIGITQSLAATVSTNAQKRFNLPRRSLLLNASHTHCGPELRPERVGLWGLPDEQGPKIERYVRQLETNLTNLVGAALADLKPARLTIGQSAAPFARNRRLPTKTGFQNQQNDDGPVDHDVPVLRVLRTDGSLAAVLFGYACHNTTLGFYQFCGDYAGFAQYNVEAAHPGAVAMFMMGTGGDQNPYPRRTLELCEQHGRSLADAVERALAGKQTDVQGPLTVAFREATLEFQPLPDKKTLQADLSSTNKYRRRKAEYLLAKLAADGRVDLTYACPVHVARLGKQILLVAIGGEVVVDYSRMIKSEFSGPVVWVAGYSNDVFGYLPSLRVLREGGYEGGGAMLYGTLPGPFAENVEERVMHTVRTLVRETDQAHATSGT